MAEQGRYYNIPREFRHCFYCESVIEDEMHFTLFCPCYNDLRVKYFPVLYTCNPTYDKFCQLMSTRKEETIRNLAMYLFYALKRRSNYLEIFT